MYIISNKLFRSWNVMTYRYQCMKMKIGFVFEIILFRTRLAQIIDDKNK